MIDCVWGSVFAHIFDPVLLLEGRASFFIKFVPVNCWLVLAVFLSVTFEVFKMSIIFSAEELTAVDRPAIPISDLDVVSLGDEFALDDEHNGLESPPLVASDLPLNSELPKEPPTLQT